MWSMLTLLISAVGSSTPTILGISTDRTLFTQSYKQGSLQGGTRLYFHGDFEGVGALDISIQVGGLDCPIREFYSSASYLECVTPAPVAPVDSYVEITALFNSLSVTMGASSYPSFTYGRWRTPQVLYMNPVEGTPEDEISFYGKWITRDWGDFEEATVNKKHMEMYLLGDGYTVDTGYSNLTAVLGANTHSETSPEIRLLNGYGLSHHKWTGEQHTLNGEKYHFRTLSRIDRVNSQSGSTMGGLALKIEGAGFPVNKDKVSVQVGGNSCAVTQLSSEYIECVLSAQDSVPTASFFEGGAGLMREVWLNRNSWDFDSLIGVVPPDRVSHIANPQIPTDEGDYILTRIYGFFKPEKTGNYIFHITSDDWAEIHLSTDLDPANMIEILQFHSWTSEKSYFYNTPQKTSPQALTADTLYYLEIRHLQRGGGSHFTMGVEIELTGDATSVNKVPFVQEIVVEPGEFVREVQNITFEWTGEDPLSGGELLIVYNTTIAKDITWDSVNLNWPCSEILDSLKEYAGLKNLICELDTSQQNQLVYSITFNYDFTDERFPLTVYTSVLPDASRLSTSNDRTLGNTPVTGTFKVSYNGEISNELNLNTWIGGIEWDLNEDIPALQNELLVKGTISSSGNKYYLMLPASMYDPTASFTLVETNFEGGAVPRVNNTVGPSVTETILKTPGENQFWWVTPSDLLRTIETLQQVQVTIDDSLAICKGNCDFTYVDPPVITAIAEADGVLTISGTGLEENDQIISIEVGHAKCTLTATSTSNYTCSLGAGVVGQHVPKVKVAGVGYYQLDDTVTFTHEYLLVVTAVTPATGTTAGGTYLTLTGTGFWHSKEDPDYSQTVSIDGSDCEIWSTTSIQIVCITSQQSVESEITVTVSTNIATSTDFSYDQSLDMTITNVTPEYASTIYPTELTITGTNFGSAALELIAKVGDEECLVSAVNAAGTELICTLLGGPKGVYKLVVYKEGHGLVHQDNFPLKFEIDNMDITTGSQYGGTEITFTGKGLATEDSTILVIINTDSVLCEVTSLPDTETIKCKTPPLPTGLETGTAYNVYVIGKLSEEADCSACTFTWSASSPVVTSIDPSSGAAGDSITLHGTNLGNDTSKVNLRIGGVSAEITSALDTSIVMTVPSVMGISPELVLTITDNGDASISGTFTNELSISTISPLTISQGGGLVTVDGGGFHSEVAVAFGSVSCTVKEIQDTKLVCEVTGYTADENALLLAVSHEAQTVDCGDATDCGLSFLSSLTSSISGHSGDLTIDGTFAGQSTGVTVHLGAYECTVIAADTSDSSIGCTPNAPAGTYDVIVDITDKGYATGGFSYTVTLAVSSVTVSYSSFAGGQTVLLAGSGLSSDVTVEVCGEPCEIESATGSSLSCLAPQLLTVYSQDTFSISNAPKLLEATDFTAIGSDSSKAYKAFDNDITTKFSESVNPDKWVGIELPAGKVLRLHSVRFIGGGTDRKHYQYTAGTQLQGNDGTNWVTLHTFQFVNDFWNEWVVPVNQVAGDDYPKYTYNSYRLYKEAADSKFYINEIKFKGDTLRISETDSEICDLTVKSPDDTTATKSAAVTYTAGNTPTLSSFTPSKGTTLGGTTITFTGLGFGSDYSGVTITIDDQSCTVADPASDTEMSCTTAARPNYKEASLSILIAGKGYVATQGLTYLYSELWSSYSTWGGLAPPRTGETVLIPSGKNVILDQATPVLNAIVIEGALIVEDKAGITLDAHYIFINGGEFIVGTENEPFLNDITITLHGSRTSQALPVYGNKVIANRNGLLDLHGPVRNPTWTVLEATAEAGATTITVQGPVDWAVGEEIVIASTSFEHTEAEVRTIKTIADTVITFDVPLEFQHYAATETYIGDVTDTIEIRAEVGLLTRNVKVRGSDEGLPEEHGVHIMSFSPNDESLITRIGYIEVYNAGQSSTLGRYPIHLHMIGVVAKSYVKGNSIHHTFNRAVTIHGVHYLRVTENVAYHTMGHTFFVEDGIETQNTLENNLAVSTRPSNSLLNTDQTPASFWITNFNNFVRGNHAAGSARYGFWYDPPDHPTGPSSTTAICPQFVELGEFSDNVAHSNGKYGLRVFHGHIPVTRPCDSVKDTSLKEWWTVNPAITANYYRLTAWKNKNNGAIIDDLGDVRFIGFKVADSGVCGIEMGWTEFSEPWNTARIEDALVIGKSANTENNVAGARGIITAQTDGMLVGNVRFHNFDADMWPIGDESKSFHSNVRDFGGRLHKLSGLSFTNSHRRIHWEIPERGIFEITDASYTGTAGAFVARMYEHLLTPECEWHEEYNAVACDGTKTIKSVLFHAQDPFSRFNHQDARIRRTSGAELQTMNETETDSDGVETTKLVPVYAHVPIVIACSKKFPLKSWAIPVVTGYDYDLYWGEVPMDWDEIRIGTVIFDSNDDYVKINMNVTDYREHYEVTRGVLPSGTNTSAEDFVDPRVITNKTEGDLDASDPSGKFLWQANDDDNDGYFRILLNGNPANENQFGDFFVVGHRCFGEHCTALADNSDTTEKTGFRWSDPTIWPNGVHPAAGETVYVPSEWDLLYDITISPVFKMIEINGILRFDNSTSRTLQAEQIFVRSGTLIIGNETDPVPSNVIHELILHGEHDSSTLAFSGTVEAGNKVLMNTGTITIHGRERVSWTQLEQNAYPGDSFLFVGATDWEIGDEVLVATSGFAIDESETFIVTGVKTSDIATDSDWVSRGSLRSNGKAKTTVDSSILTVTTPPSTAAITKLTLNAALKYYHAGTDVVIDGKSVNMRTEVGLLNRNVKISGTSGWACNIVTSEFHDVDLVAGIVQRSGSTSLSNVEIDNCGQLDLERAALRFESNSQGSSQVKNSVVKNSKTWAVNLDDAHNVEFTNNVIYNSRWRGIVVIKAADSVFKDNLIVQVIDRGLADQNEDKPCAVLSCYSGCTDVKFIGNRVAGYPFAGYISFPQECDSPGAFINNVAHSGDNGWIVSNAKKRCLTASWFLGYFNNIGLGAYASAETYKFSDFTLADNVKGMGFRTGVVENDHKNLTYEFSRFTFVGKTHHSHCEASSCTSVECGGRIGFYTSFADDAPKLVQLNEKIKIPVYKTRGNGNSLGWATMDQVTLANFRDDPLCHTHQFSFESSAKAPDYSIPQLLSNFKFLSVNESSVVYMNDPDPDWVNENDCGVWNCTGPLNILVEDKDGSIVGGHGGVLLPNNPGVARTDICSFQEHNNSYTCLYTAEQEEFYEMLMFESLDGDSFDRNVAPINVTSYGVSFQSHNGGGFRNDMNFFMDHVWDGFYTGQKHMSRFPCLIYTGHYYNISFTGTHPNKLRFYLQGTWNRNRAIVLALKYEGQKTVQVHMNGAEVAPIEYSALDPKVCGLEDPHGTNKWFYEDSVLQFVMREETELIIQVVNSIKLNMRIDMSVDEFYEDDADSPFIYKLASVLGIPVYRIRIVSVKAGSVIIDLQITPDSSLSSSEDQVNELGTINQSIEDLAQSGDLEEGLGVKILEISSEVEEAKVEDEGDEDNDTGITLPPEETNDNFNTFIEEYALVIVIGGAIIVLVLVVLVAYFYCSSRSLVSNVIPINLAFDSDKPLKMYPEDPLFKKADLHLENSSIGATPIDLMEEEIYEDQNAREDRSFH